MSVKNSVAPIALATFDSATLTGAYQAFTTLAQPCFLIRVNNASNVAVMLSFTGGASDSEVVLAATPMQLDFQQNAQPNNYIAKMAAGTKVSIKQVTAAGVGNVYLSGYYQVQAN